MIRLLLNYGADPSILNKEGLMPISLTSKTHTKSVYNDALFASIAQNEYVCTASKSLNLKASSMKLINAIGWK